MAFRADPPTVWGDDATCRGRVDPDVFFPIGQDATAHALEVVRPLCADCPVYRQCRTWALHHETEGIWAATTPMGRKETRRALRIPPPTPVHASDLIAAISESDVS